MAQYVTSAKLSNMKSLHPARRVNLRFPANFTKSSTSSRSMKAKRMQTIERLVPSTSNVITEVEPVALFPLIKDVAVHSTEWHELSEHVASNLPAITVAVLGNVASELQRINAAPALMRSAQTTDMLESVLVILELAIDIDGVNPSPAYYVKIVTVLSHIRTDNANEDLIAKYEALSKRAVFKLSAACRGKEVEFETVLEAYQAQASATLAGINFAGMVTFGRARQEAVRFAPASASQCYEFAMAVTSFVETHAFSDFECIIALMTSQLKDLSLEQMAALARAFRLENRHLWSTEIVERFLDALRCEVLSRFEEGFVGLVEAAAVVHEICNAVGVFSPGSYHDFVRTPGLWLHAEVMIPESSMHLVR